jgi:hypothetical protein
VCQKDKSRHETFAQTKRIILMIVEQGQALNEQIDGIIGAGSVANEVTFIGKECTCIPIATDDSDANFPQ